MNEIISIALTLCLIALIVLAAKDPIYLSLAKPVSMTIVAIITLIQPEHRKLPKSKEDNQE